MKVGKNSEKKQQTVGGEGEEYLNIYTAHSNQSQKQQKKAKFFICKCCFFSSCLFLCIQFQFVSFLSLQSSCPVFSFLHSSSVIMAVLPARKAS